MIGDFGLVAYPDKDPRTEHGRKLGPVEYLAPEMRDSADTADPGPADVWALAKTLWVLLTGQQLPLPGTHRHAEPAHALQQRISFTFAAELDLLLEQATQIEPQARPSMADMARELRACTAEPLEASRLAGLEQLRARVSALTAAARQDAADAQGRRDSIDAAWQELQQAVTDARTELAGLLGFELRGSESGYRASAMLGHPPFSPHDGRDLGCLLLPPGQPRPSVDVTVAGAMRVLRPGDPASIAVTLEVHRNLDHGSRQEITGIWARTYDRVPLASAHLAGILAEVRAGLRGGEATARRCARSSRSWPRLSTPTARPDSQERPAVQLPSRIPPCPARGLRRGSRRPRNRRAGPAARRLPIEARGAQWMYGPENTLVITLDGARLELRGPHHDTAATGHARASRREESAPTRRDTGMPDHRQRPRDRPAPPPVEAKGRSLA